MLELLADAGNLTCGSPNTCLVHAFQALFNGAPIARDEAVLRSSLAFNLVFASDRLRDRDGLLHERAYLEQQFDIKLATTHYGTAVSELRRKLDDPHGRSSDEILVKVILLASSTKIFERSLKPEELLVHIRGLWTLVQCRVSSGGSSAPEQYALRACTVSLLYMAMYQRQRQFACVS